MVLPLPVTSGVEVEAQIQRLAEAAKNFNASPGQDGRAVRLGMIAQAQELIRSLTDPVDMGAVHVAQAMELVAVRTLLHLKAFQYIPASGSISLAALSEATKAEAALLERLLRMLVCVGFIRQLQNGEFAHTRLSLAYGTVPGPGTHFQLIYDESFLLIDDLHVYLEEKGYKEPDDQRHSPYTWKSKQEGKTIWEIMAQHPERLQAFQSGLSHLSKTMRLTGFYDFAKLDVEGDRPILVDVGGGAGHSINRILQAHPTLPPSRFILQELKEPVEKAKAVLSQEVGIMEHNFFTPQPVQGARAYMLRLILHSYSDAVCVDILKQIVPVMAPDSVILISEFCLPERVTASDLPAVTMGITMLNMGGKERAASGFKPILEAAGLELVTVHRADDGLAAIVEARLATPAEVAPN